MKLKVRFSSLLASGAACAALLVAAGGAQAAELVSIGLQEAGYNGGAIVTEASGPTVASFSGAYGTFSTVTANGALTPKPLDFLSNTIDVSSSHAGTLTIWVTAQNLTSPSGMTSFLSSLTTNQLKSGWTVTENTFYDPGNGLYTTTDPLATRTFTGIGHDVFTSGSFSLANPFSLTEEYIITANGSGSSNNTINLSAVPEPATWGMMLLGVGMIGAGLRVGREKKAQTATA